MAQGLKGLSRALECSEILRQAQRASPVETLSYPGVYSLEVSPPSPEFLTQCISLLGGRGRWAVCLVTAIASESGAQQRKSKLSTGAALVVEGRWGRGDSKPEGQAHGREASVLPLDASFSLQVFPCHSFLPDPT